MAPALVVWLVAVATLTWSPPNGGRVASAIAVLVFLLWPLAVVATVVGLALLGRRTLVELAIVGALVTVVCVQFANWAWLEPRSYFASHRMAFDQVAAPARGEPETALAPGQAERLPFLWSGLSMSHRFDVIGTAGGKPVILLPEPSGLADGLGYVFLDGAPSTELVLNVHGRSVRLTDGRYLGGGWWWI